MTLSTKEMYDRMAKGWRGGLNEGTVCGQGSTRRNTRHVSKWIPDVCRRYDIRRVCDAGAGDLHWITGLDWDVDYQAFDLIPRNDRVQKLDITTELLPDCDAILCRMVLNHIQERIDETLDLFKQSGKYLIATQFDGGGVQRDRQFTRLDLSEYLGEPLEKCRDGHESNCYLAVWRL